MAQPDFQSRFPTDNFFHFGLNDQAIESATQKIDQLLTEAGKWVADDKKPQARASARSRIHVILEVDKNNPYLIKNVEVVQSNWLAWQITKLGKFIQGIRENKTYHFGKGGAIRNLSQYMKALSEEYAKNSSLDDHQILRSESSFNPTVRKISNFLELITPNKKKGGNQKKLKTLYLQHDIAIAHAMVRKGIQLLDSNPQQGILDILEGRRELLFRGYDLHEYSKDLFESFR
ncbi:hypothetical protein [Waddlia chondrophila]|uniref:Uncharacterized protein n=1 Tax=Waddlia chondrophila (strain ATCC VR-1470 / WSU 86-1044) TaxID=716544 RepID=D6YRS1_WADCW|nr:hypothetical protein [Waddlia chondrophila]ADI38766.1 hypothetical protein wcw_1416 [Waddlia chondrophila WSU 86-1044]